MTETPPAASILFGYDTTLPQSIIDRQSDGNLRTAALASFSALAPGMDTVEGSWAFDLIEPFCLILAQAYYDLIDVERRTSLATAVGLSLDRLGELYGVPRGPASYAEGIVTITGATGAAIPLGTAVATVGPNALIYRTTVAAQIPGAPGAGQDSIDVPVRADALGAASNVGIGLVMLFSGNIPSGLLTVTNAAPMRGGTNVQTDGPVNQYFTGYRADIHDLNNARGEGGASKHLRKWARNVPGVGKVKVREVTPYPGWVTIIVLGTNFDFTSTMVTAEPALIHDVEAYIVDPWYLYLEAEDPLSRITLGGGASVVYQADATPLGQTAGNCVLMQPGATLRQTMSGASAADNLLPQPGIWRLIPRMRSDGGQLFGNFTEPDVTPIQVDFAWNGFDLIELRVDMVGNTLSFGVWDIETGDWVWQRPNSNPGPTADRGLTSVSVGPNVWVDQINYFAVMSRDDRDVGKSPAGMRVNVIAADPVVVNVSATITYLLTGTMTTDSVNAAIHASLTDYFRSVAYGTENVARRAAVEEAIYKTTGVADVNDVVLNNLPAATPNVRFNDMQVAVLGTETWTVTPTS